MAKLLSGKDVAASLNEALKKRIEQLKQQNIQPTLAIVRVGDDPSQCAYERGAIKRCETVGVAVELHTLQTTQTQADLLACIQQLNASPTVHGVLLLSPLPDGFDLHEATASLDPRLDVDGTTSGSLARVFSGSGDGFAPCTAQACMEILHYYHIALEGKTVAIIGRSLVVGRPVSMLLLHEHATPIICHSRTQKAHELAKQADIVIVAIGRAQAIGAEYFSGNQVVIDVGTNYSEEKQALVGDVDFDTVKPHVAAITPVPGGVGAVTTSVLALHVVEAAEKRCLQQE